MKSMHISLQGKTALITGAGKGIGLGIAKALDQAGVTTLIASLEEPSQVESHFSDFRQRPVYMQADLSQPEEHRILAKKLAGRHHPVDILVNNAGIQFTAEVHEFPFDKWQQIIAINLSAAFYLSSLLLAGMQQRGFGRIINIASVHGQVASTNKAAYVAAKHGIVGLTKVIALENAAKGITCNAICPGFVHTDLMEAQIVARADAQGITHAEAKDHLLGEKQPSGEFVTTDQIGQLAVYLCSDAAAQITGANLPIDGGWMAQ